MRPDPYLSTTGEATEPRLFDTTGALDFDYPDITKAGALTLGALRISATEPAPRNDVTAFRTEAPERLFFARDDDVVAPGGRDGALIGEEGPDRLIFMDKNGEYARAGRFAEDTASSRIGGPEVFTGADQTVALAYAPTADDFFRSFALINGEGLVPDPGLMPISTEGFAAETAFDLLLF